MTILSKEIEKIRSILNCSLKGIIDLLRARSLARSLTDVIVLVIKQNEDEHQSWSDWETKQLDSPLIKLLVDDRLLSSRNARSAADRSERWHIGMKNRY